MNTHKTYDVVTSGYVSMDRIIKLQTPAQVGFTSLVTNKTSADIQYGGCSVNIAHNLNKLGVTAIPVMRVGDDFEQTGFKHFLEQSGIPIDATVVVPGERTSLCYMVQDNEGQHITLFYPGAMDGKFARPFEAEWGAGASLGVMTVAAQEDNQQFLDVCRKRKLPLVFSMKGDMDAFPHAFLDEVLRYSSLIFTNSIERATIEESFGYDMRALVADGDCAVLVTTLGKDGCQYYWKENGVLMDACLPICDFGPPVDTTGSGDAFVSGFLYGYLRDKTPRECAMLGTVLASFVIEQEGCCTGAPTEAQLLERCAVFAQTLKGSGE